ncbi:hypothetical protein MTR_5g031500 [Medicago truncatula]|uniref:Uncharacterized protein n=1 Tax=Medicago truncatula TaxID=3880 RepID=G7KGK3_MEDTR|nr:hypothetical protein MTR_5g031500 [Medicago truncatula]
MKIKIRKRNKGYPSLVLPSAPGETKKREAKQILAFCGLRISNAKVTVYGPSVGRSGGNVVISGMPDQTFAAQSLLQAFIQAAPRHEEVPLVVGVHITRLEVVNKL